MTAVETFNSTMRSLTEDHARASTVRRFAAGKARVTSGLVSAGYAKTVARKSAVIDTLPWKMKDAFEALFETRATSDVSGIDEDFLPHVATFVAYRLATA